MSHTAVPGRRAQSPSAQGENEIQTLFGTQREFEDGEIESQQGANSMPPRDSSPGVASGTAATSNVSAGSGHNNIDIASPPPEQTSTVLHGLSVPHGTTPGPGNSRSASPAARAGSRLPSPQPPASSTNKSESLDEALRRLVLSLPLQECAPKTVQLIRSILKVCIERIQDFEEDMAIVELLKVGEVLFSNTSTEAKCEAVVQAMSETLLRVTTPVGVRNTIIPAKEEGEDNERALFVKSGKEVLVMKSHAYELFDDPPAPPALSSHAPSQSRSPTPTPILNPSTAIAGKKVYTNTSSVGIKVDKAGSRQLSDEDDSGEESVPGGPTSITPAVPYLPLFRGKRPETYQNRESIQTARADYKWWLNESPIHPGTTDIYFYQLAQALYDGKCLVQNWPSAVEGPGYNKHIYKLSGGQVWLVLIGIWTGATIIRRLTREERVMDDRPICIRANGQIMRVSHIKAAYGEDAVREDGDSAPRRKKTRGRVRIRDDVDDAEGEEDNELKPPPEKKAKRNPRPSGKTTETRIATSPHDLKMPLPEASTSGKVVSTSGKVSSTSGKVAGEQDKIASIPWEPTTFGTQAWKETHMKYLFVKILEKLGQDTDDKDSAWENFKAFLEVEIVLEEPSATDFVQTVRKWLRNRV